MWEARQVGALAILVLSVAAIDSLNPSTIAPAAVLALGDRPAWQVGLFTTGVFTVSTGGGLVLLFAVGRSVVARFAHPSPHTEHVLELAVGITLLLVAGLLWVLRHRLRAHLGRANTTGGRSALLLGAGIMAIELPTAFPYFAAILATLGAVNGAAQQTVFILLYNLVFVAPLLGLTLFVALTGHRYRDRINRISTLIRTHGPDLLPPGIAIIGAALVIIGIHGL
jgi:cytochrome c biogenesis protein CcdA